MGIRQVGHSKFARIAVGIAVGVGVVATPSWSFAASGTQGTILVKGPGSVYAAGNANVALSVAAGTAASFGIKVKNTGSSAAQFEIRFGKAGSSCAAACTSSAVLVRSGLTGPKLTPISGGYLTSPMASGSTATFLLKVTENKAGSTRGDEIIYYKYLADASGTPVDGNDFVWVNNTRSSGTSGAEQFLSSTGTPSTSGNPGITNAVISTPSVAAGKTFRYAVKLVNDGAVPTQIGYNIWTVTNCRTYFPLKITQGTKDVTAAVEGGTYQTVRLVHGGSVALTVTGTYLAGGAQCLQGEHAGSIEVVGRATDSAGDITQAYVDFAPAAP